MENNILVFCEQKNDKIAEVSLELVSKANELARELNCKVDAVLLGFQLDKVKDEIKDYGINRLFFADKIEFKNYLTLPVSKYIVKLIEEYKPQIALFGASGVGRDIAPRVASKLKCGLTADCTDLQIGNYSDPIIKKDYTNILYQIRPAFGGNIIATIVNPETRPQMATVREGVMKMEKPIEKGVTEEIELNYKLDPSDLLFSILDKQVKEKSVDLKSAQIIVAGGFGVGSVDNFQVIQDFAKLLKAEVGASRAAVDAGFINHDHQVGQTGVTVRPKLYFAIGISGAIQHSAGMQESNIIIAINKDPNAPIFKIAHYGIIGDFVSVIAKFTKAYKNHLK